LKSGYVLSRLAFQDICEIWDYLAEHVNLSIADEMEEQLFRTFETLVQFPNLGHQRPDLTKRPVLFLPVQSFLVVYEPALERITIHAVLHRARDLKRILGLRPS
jgi:plasmid stabilization system protein ParE